MNIIEHLELCFFFVVKFRANSLKMDEELLIEAIRDYPVIYDVSSALPQPGQERGCMAISGGANEMFRFENVINTGISLFQIRIDYMHRVPTVYAKFREPISIFCDVLPSFYLKNKHRVEIRRH